MSCDCGGPCFYCGRALSSGRHEHDHFPLPVRHGGSETVPACRECHTLKDRTWPLGVRETATDFEIEQPVFRAIMAGLPETGSRYCSVDGALDMPLMLGWLWQYWHDLDRDEPESWGDVEHGIEVLCGLVRRLVIECGTPEARIFVAQVLGGYLDKLDGALRAGRVR